MKTSQYVAPMPFPRGSPLRSVTAMISEGQIYSHRRQPMQFYTPVVGSKVNAKDPPRHRAGKGRFCFG